MGINYSYFYSKSQEEFFDVIPEKRRLLMSDSMLFDFVAVSRNMSYLFVESPSIRKFFIDLAETCNADNIVLLRDGYEDEVIWQNQKYRVIKK